VAPDREHWRGKSRILEFIMKNILIIFSLFFSIQSFSQSKDTSANNVIIHKDSRLDVLAKKEAELNSAYSRALDKTMMGYRIQVISTTDRAYVMKVRSTLLKKFPSQKNYLIFQAPYVKLRFGNFKTKEEADTYMKQISKLLNGASLYLVPERIEKSE
jgi:hypothetical protein